MKSNAEHRQPGHEHCDDLTRLGLWIALLILIVHPTPLMAGPIRHEDKQDVGVIEGQVVDVDGAPVAGVTVSAQYDGPGSFLMPESKTSAEGRFRLESVLPGWVRLTTSKAEDGYPNTNWSGMFDPNDPEPPEVFVRAGETTSGVLVRLGPKCGKVTGTILDASTGKPLLTARLRLAREDTREDLTMGPDENGAFLFALPDLDYTLEVTAPHFKWWRSDKDAEQIPVQHIRVSQRDVLRLKIALDPAR